MHSEGNLILALTCPPMMKAIMTIGRNRELLQTRPYLTKKGTTIGVNVKAYLLVAWKRCHEQGTGSTLQITLHMPH